jgi:hypothetical protein
MFRLMLATALGAIAAIVILWSHGWLLALACAPLGGSAAALCLVLAIAVFDVVRPAAIHSPEDRLPLNVERSFVSE